MANQMTSSNFEPWHDLFGKVVMVTGASSGLGRDFCIDLAKAGCRIIAAARRIDRLIALCDEINRTEGGGTSGYDVRAVVVEIDINAKGPAIEASVKKAWDAFGRIDCLINNAGVRGNVRSPLQLSQVEWESTMRTNLKGTWLVSKYICMHMRDAKQGGSIINISSISGLSRGQLPGAVAYSSSKTAVVTLTKIRVNSINPGIFRSEITKGLMEKKWLNNVTQRTVPLRTYGTADPALTRPARDLIHDSSEYITGNVFIVDAGATLPGLPIFSSL